ncbi:Flp pilus assembly protein TadG [Sphingomonas jinjuensis]|uniref:Flp pilus assembly protein TadG n=1 Tax=Sphingomonas jinjuensis TaxID=535907 RepID=A0A840F4K8_9SPHN|nr:TadE/TadG family type IV pilus assembly protein [Sphingomonas jinjuensis]MBB4154243.1 Flp pilus assembly protein TadG [Sphingomonas jinjuensis]
MADKSGATIVEFAIVSIPFFALLIAILQTSLVFFAQQALDTASEKAVRILVTGSAQKSGMTAAQFKTQACTSLPTFMQCANLIVDVQSAAQFSSIDTSTPTITYDSSGKPVSAFDPGDSSEITIVRLMYIWNVAPGPLGFDLSTLSRGKRLMVSTQVFKSEIS